jgi:hypothetical protein
MHADDAPLETLENPGSLDLDVDAAGGAASAKRRRARATTSSKETNNDDDDDDDRDDDDDDDAASGSASSDDDVPLSLLPGAVSFDTKDGRAPKPVSTRWKRLRPSDGLAIARIPQLLVSYDFLLAKHRERRDPRVPVTHVNHWQRLTTAQCDVMLEHARRLANTTQREKREAVKREGKYRCEMCGARFYYPAKLAEHANLHSGTTPFRCTHDGCDEAFPTRDRLRTHAQKHDAKHACALCGKRFQTAGACIVHPSSRLRAVRPSSRRPSSLVPYP